nr:MAG TPA: hypothetical protein [Caudoviricetes sp.]DAH91131.1 MAG TPA: hypothetical protein [Caudoviricetes sp.]DAZ42228.1 MAG TPA: hypothetical protein [Caudoviricetes sp.]DAZ61365.1 MAG TPA: hypothetical protein [Caudoviricetes sp.]
MEGFLSLSGEYSYIQVFRKEILYWNLIVKLIL